MHPQEGVDFNDLTEDGGGVLVITAVNVSINTRNFITSGRKTCQEGLLVQELLTPVVGSYDQAMTVRDQHMAENLVTRRVTTSFCRRTVLLVVTTKLTCHRVSL